MFLRKKLKVDGIGRRLRVFKTEDDITLKISDRGGGIPRKRRGKIFTYMYSTAPKVGVNSLNFTAPPGASV